MKEERGEEGQREGEGVVQGRVVSLVVDAASALNKSINIS